MFLTRLKIMIIQPHRAVVESCAVWLYIRPRKRSDRLGFSGVAIEGPSADPKRT